ncbi:MAG: polynucleotide adenylyltransferase PcnB [Polyangiales bacterium]
MSTFDPFPFKPYPKHDPQDEPEPVVYAHKIARGLLDLDAAKVIRRLSRHGHQAYLVGGGVRDLLLGRRPKDFDVATSARPNEVRDLFRNCRVVGRRFRLAHVLFAGGKIVEVATFRKDSNQRYEVFRPRFASEFDVCQGVDPVLLAPLASSSQLTDTSDLLITNDNIFGEPHEDAIRRDFTINGLFYDLERGEVIDYVGGLADLQDRVVRMIGEPAVRFREDPIRILRAIKFSARLDLGIDSAVYDAMVQYRGELAKSAPPRVFEELFRLMRGGAAHRSIYLAWDTGVLAEILPELSAYLDDAPEGAELTWGRLRAIDAQHDERGVASDSILLSALILGPLSEAMEGQRDPSVAFENFMHELSLRLAVPRRLKDRVRLLTQTQKRMREGKLGALPRRDYFDDAATLFAIDCKARGEEVPAWASDPSDAIYRATKSKPPRRRRRRRQ